MIPWDSNERKMISRPDRLFATSGRGVKGSVTEYRYGLRARIHTEIEYDAPMKRSWIFPSTDSDPSWPLNLLLALPSQSAVLCIADDYTNVDEPGMSRVQFDVSSRTLTAAQISGDTIIQITEVASTIISPNGRYVLACDRNCAIALLCIF
jgi:hypothetical protein